MSDTLKLFDDYDKMEEWRKHWEGMPEFENVDSAPFQSILIHFKTKEDREEFAKLISQKFTYKTKYTWFPKKNDLPPKNFIYVGEKDPTNES
jgi:hypothetical protein